MVAFLAVGVGLSFFGVSLLFGEPAKDGFLFAIGVTVALVPEGLLPTVTLSLAMGAQRMAARNALVRHLEAVETLGSTTFVCTDKTGTLTRNEMNVVAVWTTGGAACRWRARATPRRRWSTARPRRRPRPGPRRAPRWPACRAGWPTGTAAGCRSATPWRPRSMPWPGDSATPGPTSTSTPGGASPSTRSAAGPRC